MGKYRIHSDADAFYFELIAANKETILVGSHYALKGACLKGIDSVRRNAPAAHLEDQTLKDFEVQPNPKFELYRDKKRRYCYRLCARNGKVIAEGGGYTSKELCRQGIESVRRNAVKSKIAEK